MTDTIFAWSQTADDNQTADAEAAWPEFQNPDTVNNSARAIMRRVAQLLGDLAPRRTSTGTGNAYIVDGFAGGAVLRNGERIAFLPDRSNTAACTLQVKGRAPKPWRPKPGVEFAADNILAGVPVEAFYRAETDEWVSGGTGFYVSSTAAGVSLQSLTARMPQIGDMVVSLAPTPGAGRIRLTEATQSILKSAYPELNSWLSGNSYPWGSSATHFNLPPAAGYYLRFAGTNATVDTGGPRTAGSTQADQHKQTLIPPTGLAATTTISPNPHDHAYIGPSDSSVTTSGGGAQAYQLARTTTPVTLAAATTLSGNATLPGGDEVRTRNVAFHVEIIASTALAAAQIAVFGFAYKWDTGTAAADPGAGRVRANSATLTAATQLHISTTDGLGVDLSAILTGLSLGTIINLSRVGAQTNRVVARVTGAPANNTTYISVPVAVVVTGGTMAQNDSLAAEFSTGGPSGPAGPSGPNTGLDYAWTVGTSGDPGAGNVGGNNAALGSITSIRISKSGRNGEALSGYLATWDDSTNTAHLGHLRLFPLADRSKFIEASVTAVADSTTHYTLTVAVTAANGPIASDALTSVAFYRTGDKGAVGPTGPAGPTGPTGPQGPAGGTQTVVSFNSRAAASAATIDAAVNTVLLMGFAAAGDAPVATYRRIGSQPAHAGKFQSADGQWWVIVGPELWIEQFGAVGDSVTDDLPELMDAETCRAALGGTLNFAAKNYFLNNPTSYVLLRPRWRGAEANGTVLTCGGNSSICFFLTGAGGLTAGFIDRLVIWAAAARTTGQALRLDGDATYQPDEFKATNLKISGAGTWDIPLYCYGADRTGNVGSGIPEGLRFVTFTDLFIGRGTSLGAYFDTTVQMDWNGGGTFGSAGTGNNITVTSTNATLKSTYTMLRGVNCQGLIFMDKCDGGVVLGQAGSVTLSANSSNIWASGVCPTVSNSGTSNVVSFA